MAMPKVLKDIQELKTDTGSHIANKGIHVPLINVGGTVWVESNMTNTNYRCAYFSNDLWVAGGDSGLCYSTDGRVWEQSNISSNYFYDICCVNNMWTACCNNGIYYSTDGMNWTKSNLSNAATCVDYGNSVWVAGSVSNNGLYYSTDGMTWDYSTEISTGKFYSLRYTNNIWVAGGDGTGLYYSTDGIHWTSSNITEDFINYVYHGNNLWLALGDAALYYSTDGMNWTASNISPGGVAKYKSIYYASGMYVIASPTGLYYSTDGMNWVQSNISSKFNTVCYGDGIWVAGSSDNEGIYYSIDGMNWEQSDQTYGWFWGLYYANHIWVGCSYSSSYGLYYSESDQGKTLMVDNSGNAAWAEDTKAEVFLVTFTQDEETENFSADKTYAEIVSAHEAGKVVLCTLEGFYFGQLVSLISIINTAWFRVESFTGTSKNGGLIVLTINSANEVNHQYISHYSPEFSQYTILTSGWSSGVYSFESDFPKLLYDIEIELDSTATESQVEAWSNAKPTAVFGTNTMKALGDVPTVDIPVIVKKVVN